MRLDHITPKAFVELIDTLFARTDEGLELVLSFRYRILLLKQFLLGDHSEMEPPDPLPNSEVKRLSANGSVGFPHARVGHRQAPNYGKPRSRCDRGFFVTIGAK